MVKEAAKDADNPMAGEEKEEGVQPEEQERLLQKPIPWTEGWSEAGVLTVTILLSVSFPAAI